MLPSFAAVLSSFGGRIEFDQDVEKLSCEKFISGYSVLPGMIEDEGFLNDTGLKLLIPGGVVSFML